MMASCPDLSYDHDEMPDVSRTVFRRARKQHRCCECLRDIRPGERYEHDTSLYDGRWSTHRTCLRCVAVRRCLTPDGWIYGELHEAVHEAERWSSEEERRACQIEIREERAKLETSESNDS